jgi:hypothetical protein
MRGALQRDGKEVKAADARVQWMGGRRGMLKMNRDKCGGSRGGECTGRRVFDAAAAAAAAAAAGSLCTVL